MLEIYQYYAPIALITGFGWFLTRQAWPATRVLAPTMYTSAPFGYARAFGRVLALLRHGIGRPTVYRATRYLIETELLDPPPERPDRFQYDTVEYKEKMEEYRVECRKQSKRVKERFGELVHNAHGGIATIEVGTCFDLYRAEANIKHYFGVLKSSKGIVTHDTDRFLSRVHVRKGFIAPLYLLSGLLAHFDEDSDPLIQYYGRAVSRGDEDPLQAPRARSLQAFLFENWLMWGPSIPICTCRRWQGPHVLQFGYGDENNSIIVTVDEPDQVVARLLQATNGSQFVKTAAQAEVTGVLRWGPQMRQSQLGPAQQPARSPSSGRLFLESSAKNIVAKNVVLASGDDDVDGTYYSAYVWVMFVICDSAGKPLEREPWNTLIPFHIHGNVADEANMSGFKEQLVAQALPSIERILKDAPHVTLKYACAIDDSGCSSPIRYPSRERSILEIMRAAVDLDHLKERDVWDRMVLETPGPYSSCRLVRMLVEYEREISNSTSSGVVSK